jgi:hypothetical protein
VLVYLRVCRGVEFCCVVFQAYGGYSCEARQS